MIILPQRNPVVLAKELATLNVVSGGRLLFGLGVGYPEPEFRALGAPFEQRSAVTDEAIEAIKSLLDDGKTPIPGPVLLLQQRRRATAPSAKALSANLRHLSIAKIIL